MTYHKCMIERQIKAELDRALAEYPVVTIVGPRQAGKTTLARSYADFHYVNLESPENREHARDDPKGFLNQYPDHVIFDEIQRVPELLSYIQVRVDERKRNGEIILTGSHQPELKSSISQSLAGRTALLHLLPLSIAELSKANIRFDRFEQYVCTGFLPRVYDQHQRPFQAYSNYYQTYVERDVRQLINLKDAALFEKFMKLLAGRVGQLSDYNALANDVGVDAKTIKHWLSILEASFIVFKLPPYYENFGKRAIKSPKFYFTEIGLLAFLLGLEDPSYVSRDPLVGSIFENLIVIECLKSCYNEGRPSNLYFYRDSNRNEVDIVIDQGPRTKLIEVKAAETYQPHFFKNIQKVAASIGKDTAAYLVYNGEPKAFSDNRSALRFDQVERVFSA